MNNLMDTSQCLVEYAKLNFPAKGAKGAEMAKQPMADFVGATTHTITRWINQKTFPVGDVLIRLQFFLQHVRCRVKELERLRTYHPVAYQLAELLAYQLVTVSRLVELFGYTDSHGVYRVTAGVTQLPAEKHMLANELVGELGPALEEAKRRWTQRLMAEGLMKQETKLQPASQSGVVARQDTEIHQPSVVQTNGQSDSSVLVAGLTNEKIVLMLAGMMGVMLPLVEAVLQPPFNKEDRKSLRELTGREQVFRLANALNKLCSEKSLEQLG